MPVNLPKRYGAVLRASVSQQTASHGFGAGIGSARPMARTHSHGDLELNFVHSGRVLYAFRDRQIELREHTLCGFWAGIPHQVIEIDPATRFVWLHVPLTVLLRWNLAAAFMGRIFAGELVVDQASLPWDADLLRRWLRDLSSYESDLNRTVEIEVEARVRRLASRQHQAGGNCAAERSQSAQVTRMTAYLLAHFREDLSTDDVARAGGLNRHYAMRLFKKESGISIWQYLLRLRVSHAQHMLLTTDAPVVTVGLESGFNSPSRFYETFTSECKVSPAEYRRRASAQRPGAKAALA